MHRLAVGLAIVFAPVALAGVADAKSFFPLRAGAEWSFRDAHGVESTLVAVRAPNGSFRLEGFPGTSGIRVRWSGDTLQAWDERARRWEPLLRFGARTGSSYAVDLPEPLWRRVRVTVAARNATAGRHRGVIRFALEPSPELADAGLLELAFASGVGLVRWTEQTIAGPVAHVLVGRS